MANKTHITTSAIVGQPVALVQPKPNLAGCGYQFKQRRHHDVAQPMVGHYKVVTGVNIAIMLQNKRQPASFLEDAHICRKAAPTRLS